MAKAAKQNPPAKRVAKKPARKNRPALGSNPLPPPVDVATVADNPPQSSEPKRGGIFEALLGSSNPDPVQAAVSGVDSSTSNFDAEAARLLAAVPDVIGPEPGAEESASVGGTSQPSNAIPFPAASGPVTAKMLQRMLQNSFAAVATWRKRECWNVTDAEAEALTECTLPVLNPWVAQMLERLLGEWSQTRPELTAMIVGWSMVLGPKFAADMAEGAKQAEAARERPAPGASPNVVRPGPAQSQPKPTGTTWFHDSGEQAA
jgi:hypothetical protein